MAVKFTNNAATTLAAGINSSATSISVTDGSVFPSLSSGEHFYCTFDDTTNTEIVKVTARSGNTLTVVRGQDDTTARAFSSGDKAELRVVAALLEDVKTEVTSTLSVDTFTGDDATTAFTLSQAPSSEDNLIVFIEGVYQNPGDFTLSGTTLTLDSAPLVGRKIVAYHVSGAVAGNNLNHDQFTFSAGNSPAFTLSIAPIHENNTQVFIDGVYQQKDSYAVSGTTLTLDASPDHGATVEVMTFTQTDVNTIPASFVAGLTEVAAVGSDHLLVYDATDGALKKALASDLIETVGATPTFSTANITNTTTGDSLLFTTTEDSSTAAPVITLKRNSSSPADADYLGQLKFKGENDADQEVVYAKITSKIQDASDGSEDGLLEFANIKAGSQTITARLKSDKFELLNGTALDVTGTYTGQIGLFEQEGTGGGNHGVEIRCASTSGWAFLTKVNGTAKLGQTGDVTYVGGQLGIGTTSPSASHAIDIHNTAPIINVKDTNGSGTAATGYLRFEDSGGTSLGYLGFGSGSTSTLHITNHTDNARIDFLTNSETQFVVTNKDNLDSEDIAVLQGTATGGTDVIDAIRMTKMGYGASYQCTQFGVAGGGRNISLMYDPSTNTSGAFGGNGECIVGNGFKLLGANAANNGFIGMMRVAGDNTLRIGGNYTVGGWLSFDTSGNATFSGSLSKGSGSFKIDHPLQSKKDTHHLVHSFVEAPQADNIYRGKVDLVDGSATVNIDSVAGMTEGTFVALNREVQCFTSNESDWDAVKGSVSGNILTISCQNNSSTATISWLVIGERKDKHMYDTDWTDENGKVIVEPEKVEEIEEEISAEEREENA